MSNRVERIYPVSAAGASPRVQRDRRTGESFGSMIQQCINQRERDAKAVNFSKHAMARAEERGIELTPDLMDQLAASVEKAKEKGANNILAFSESQAFIINVPYGRVITTMTQAEMRNNIFTNIDSAVIL